MHARRFAKQHIHFHVNRVVAEQGIDDDQLRLDGRGTEYRERTTLAFAQATKLFQRRRRDGEHVAFLRLVAPDFTRTHPRLFRRHCAQIKTRTGTAAVRQFGQCIRDATGTDIMQTENRI